MTNDTPIRSDLRVPLEFLRLPKTVEDRYLLFLGAFGAPSTYWPPQDVCALIGMPYDDANLRRMQRALIREGLVCRGESGVKPERGGKPYPAYFLTPAADRQGGLLEAEALDILERRQVYGGARWCNATTIGQDATRFGLGGRPVIPAELLAELETTTWWAAVKDDDNFWFKLDSSRKAKDADKMWASHSTAWCWNAHLAALVIRSQALGNYAPLSWMAWAVAMGVEAARNTPKTKAARGYAWAEALSKAVEFADSLETEIEGGE